MNLKDIISNRGWFVISATQEELGAHDDLANLAATLRLSQQLDALDLSYVPCAGVYRGVDQGTSFLVIGDEAVGRDLCRRYRQESILTPAGLIDADGNLIARRVGDRFDEEALSSEFYSVFRNGLFWSADLEFI